LTELKPTLKQSKKFCSQPLVVQNLPINRIEEQNRIADERGRKIDERLDRLGENLDQLREDVDIAFQTISLLSENTDRSMAQFRAEMRDSRAETKSYLGILDAKVAKW
jgi:chlorite dismutase